MAAAAAAATDTAPLAHEKRPRAEDDEGLNNTTPPVPKKHRAHATAVTPPPPKHDDDDDDDDDVKLLFEYTSIDPRKVHSGRHLLDFAHLQPGALAYAKRCHAHILSDLHFIEDDDGSPRVTPEERLYFISRALSTSTFFAPNKDDNDNEEKEEEDDDDDDCCFYAEPGDRLGVPRTRPLQIRKLHRGDIEAYLRALVFFAIHKRKPGILGDIDGSSSDFITCVHLS